MRQLLGRNLDSVLPGKDRQGPLDDEAGRQLRSKLGILPGNPDEGEGGCLLREVRDEAVRKTVQVDLLGEFFQVAEPVKGLGVLYLIPFVVFFIRAAMN